MFRIKTEDLKAAARGKWDIILERLAPSDFQDILARPRKYHQCLFHSGKNKGSFRLFKDFEEAGTGYCFSSCGSIDGFKILMELNNWDFNTCKEQIAHVLELREEPSEEDRRRWEHQRRLAEADRQRRLAAEDADKVQKLNKLSSQLVPFTNQRPGRLYLEKRGILPRSSEARRLFSDSTFFHPSLDYWSDDEDGNPVHHGKFPALVFLVSDVDGNPVTFHRIYLDENGNKAPVDSPKKMMEVPSYHKAIQSAIRFGEPVNGTLALAEGPETALAVSKLYGFSCWSTISAGGLENFQLPADVDHVLIFADKDASGTGQRVADALAERLRLEGKLGVPVLPSQPIVGKGVDWADVLDQQGILGFPRPSELRSLIDNAA